MMVPFWVPNIVRHLIFWGTQKGSNILTTTYIGFGLCCLGFGEVLRMCIPFSCQARAVVSGVSGVRSLLSWGCVKKRVPMISCARCLFAVDMTTIIHEVPRSSRGGVFGTYCSCNCFSDRVNPCCRPVPR